MFTEIKDCVPSNVTRLFVEHDKRNMRMLPIRDVNPVESTPKKIEIKEGTYVNINLHGINKFIMYNSSCPNRDLGVHMGLS